MIRNILRKKLGLTGPISSEVSTLDLLHFLLCKGAGSYLRGFFWQFLFRKAQKPLFVGAHCQIRFAGFVEAGKDVRIGAYSYVNGLSQKGLKLADHVHIREYAWIQSTSQLDQLGVGIEIGTYTYIGPHCYLGGGGGITIGADVLIGANVQILAENHRFEDKQKPIRTQGVSRKGIHIGDNVWVGNSAIILDGVTIGSGSIIGAGAVVTQDIPAQSVAAGNPARVIRSR